MIGLITHNSFIPAIKTQKSQSRTINNSSGDLVKAKDLFVSSGSAVRFGESEKEKIEKVLKQQWSFFAREMNAKYLGNEDLDIPRYYENDQRFLHLGWKGPRVEMKNFYGSFSHLFGEVLIPEWNRRAKAALEKEGLPIPVRQESEYTNTETDSDYIPKNYPQKTASAKRQAYERFKAIHHTIIWYK